MKPSIQFIIEFYFGENADRMPFAANKNFDAAYLQQQCDKIYEKIQFSVGKTKAYWNKKEKTALASQVRDGYK